MESTDLGRVEASGSSSAKHSYSFAHSAERLKWHDGSCRHPLDDTFRRQTQQAEAVKEMF